MGRQRAARVANAPWLSRIGPARLPKRAADPPHPR